MTTPIGIPVTPVPPCHLRPLGRRVILRKVEESTRNGIRTQLDGAPREEGSQEYVVVALPSPIAQSWIFEGASGGGEPITLSLGLRVYLALHKGWKIETRDGEEWYAAEVDDILAVAIGTLGDLPNTTGEVE